MNEKIHKFLLFTFLILIVILAAISSYHYQGSLLIYLFFTISSSLLFFNGLQKNSIYAETFIGIFFWLGFWLKFSIRASFFNLKFNESIGFYNGNIKLIDNALIISSIGFCGFICATQIRKYFDVFSYKKQAKISLVFLEKFYLKNRLKILLIFFLFSLLIASLNIAFGLYQKGLPPSTFLPFGINKFFAWLILFGLSSIGSFLVYYDYRNNQKGCLSIFLYFIDCFFANVSMLSRGFILNGSSIIFAHYFEELRGKKIFLSFLVKTLTVITFLLLFITSVFLVNYLRSSKFAPESSLNNLSISYSANSIKLAEVAQSTKVLFIDRWVGIEGAISVTSYQHLGWDLWKQAWTEKYKDNGTSFYDLNLINSPYKNQNLEKKHFISLPGIIAFLYYPQSYLFLFFSCLILGLLATLLELFVYSFSGGNVFLSSLIGQVIAYRFAHFGYVPAQSYLLFGTIVLNVLLFYFLDKSFLVINNFFMKKL